RPQGAGDAQQVLCRTQSVAERARHVEALHRGIPAAMNMQLRDEHRVTMAAGDLSIRVRNVSHQFGEEGEPQFVRAMLETSLDIRRGELMCLIGPSGCGKSTLLNIIGGLLTPTSGKVLVGDTEVRGPLPQDIAYVFQENALFPWSTVIENVNLGMMFQGVPRAEREPRAGRGGGSPARGWASRIWLIFTRASFRAACATAPHWPGRSVWNPASC